MTEGIFQFCSKHRECAITVRSFANLIDFKVSFLPDSFMPTCNCEKPLKDSLLGHLEAFVQF